MLALQLLELLRRAVVGVRHHRAAAHALLGHLAPAHAGVHSDFSQARSTPGMRYSSSLIFSAFEVVGVEDVALGVLDHHAQRVAEAAQLVLVLEVVADVRMALRQHLLVAGVQRDAEGDEAEDRGDDRAHDDHDQAVVEDERARAQLPDFWSKSARSRTTGMASMLAVCPPWLSPYLSTEFGSARRGVDHDHANRTSQRQLVAPDRRN